MSQRYFSKCGWVTFIVSQFAETPLLDMGEQIVYNSPWLSYLTVTRTSNGRQSTSQEFHEYVYNSVFQVPQGKVAYLGRFIIVDPGMKGKGYFGRMGEMMKKMVFGLFSGSMMADTAEINRVDSFDEDKSWLDGEYKQFHGVEISNSLHSVTTSPEFINVR